MGALKGNKDWKKRKKHGRNRVFKTGRALQSAWESYFNWADKNPWYKNDFVRGGDSAGMIIKLPIQRPYTFQGFQEYHGLGFHYIDQLEKGLKDKKDKASKDLSSVLAWARNKCYVNKFEGAAVGAFNASIIMSVLGLKEKAEIDHTSKGEKIVNPPPIQVYNVGPPLAGDETEVDDKKSSG